MSVKMDSRLIFVGVGIAAAWYLYGKRKAIEQAINPASNKNIVYSALSTKTNTPGTWLYNLLNPGAGTNMTTATKLPAGSPGWWTSQSLPVPPGVTSDPATWTTLNPATMPISGG